MKVEAAFFIRSCSRALVPAQYVNNHLFTTVFLSPLLLYSADGCCFWSTDLKKQRITSLCPQQSCSTASLLPPALRPSPPFFVNFMDLSANGLPPHHPSHIWHLQPGPSRMLSFPVAPPLALSGRSEPAAGEGGGSSLPSSFYLVNWSAAVISND